LTYADLGITITGMSTISFSVEPVIKADFAKWAKQQKKSQSEILREMYTQKKFTESLLSIQEKWAPKAAQLGLKTEDDVAAFLKK
jgi:hypothetical protein